MTVTEMFDTFLNNLKIDNADKISLRYGEITASLNKKFRDTESKTDNSLQVGSYGRHTGIKGISDLDMLYIMPKNMWDDYKNGKQSKLLTEAKDAIKNRYPHTKVCVDRLVVTVTYNDFHVEVQPVFEFFDENDQSYFKYPDTYNGGSWKITKPRQEIAAMKEFVDNKNKNLRRLCKMIRAWKNKHGIAMGGLLIDTLAYNFLKSTKEYDNKGFLYYDWMSKDFFKFLKDEPVKDHYQALGSGQDVKVKQKFQNKAKKAYELCLEAIEKEGSTASHEKWKKVYGKAFPSAEEEAASKFTQSWKNTEEYIEDYHNVDVRYKMKINCEVSQNGFRTLFLKEILKNKYPLLTNKKLIFYIEYIDVPEPYTIKWKVLNRGDEAKRRDCIRGSIITGHEKWKETTNFKGPHMVECYAIKDNIVVARAYIDVPIQDYRIKINEKR